MFKANSVAVLGTGIMGGAIARNLAAAGLEARAWNRTREAAQPLEDDGVGISDTPAEAVSGVDAVITMLATGDVVREVMTGDDGALAGMGSGSTWLQMSTVGIAATDELAGLAREAGVAFVDAPVLGTKQPAEEGKLVVLAAGPAAALEACTPIFDAIGTKTIEFDETGQATRLKLVLNNWVLSVTVATAETISLAERLGVDPRMFLEAIEGGNLDSAYAQMKGRMMHERSFDPSFPLRLAAKDARLVLEAASGNGDEPALPRAIEHRLAQANELGHGDEDMAAVYRAAVGEPAADR
jgi:3-hydroxyisobutyrate dehydrogenase